MSATRVTPVYEPVIDPSVHCSSCEAVCCRLLVVLMPDDVVPARFIARDERDLEVMARGEEGWCAALNLDTMQCSIYEQRPYICRGFAMGGPYCLSEREKWPGLAKASIPIALC